MHIFEVQKKLEHSLLEIIKGISKENAAKDLPKDIDTGLGIPKDYKHGDLTTNIAMRLASNFSLNSMELAAIIKERLEASLKKQGLSNILSVDEVLRPGFINFKIDPEYLNELLLNITKEKDSFGRSKLGSGQKINIEFVSANPTGPLTVAHGRQAAVGDALSQILEFSGYDVTKEYFINDVGTQIEILGKSVYSHYLTLNGVSNQFPENGYQGEYIKGIAALLNEKYGNKFLKENEKNIEKISEFAATHILGTIKSDLKAFGVSFDNWFSQRTLPPKIINDVLGKLKEKGYVYEKEGATWFKSTALGDDKDRVVIKSDGSFTYLAPDIAYHLNKYKRKFNRLIDIWGPDHHGYIPRIKASISALGYDKGSISILIVQLATIFRGGVALSMSTRKGEFITLKEVMDEVGCDVTRFFFLMRKLDSHLDFDLEVAKKNSMDNPVYYIQYAHARIASIFGFSSKLSEDLKKSSINLNLLKEPEEKLLLRMLSRFPLIIETSAKTLEPYRMIEYLNDLAKAFHSFYAKHRVVSEEEILLTRARLELVDGIKIVLANGLKLLGISLPERM